MVPQSLLILDMMREVAKVDFQTFGCDAPILIFGSTRCLRTQFSYFQGHQSNRDNDFAKPSGGSLIRTNDLEIHHEFMLDERMIRGNIAAHDGADGLPTVVGKVTLSNPEIGKCECPGCLSL